LRLVAAGVGWSVIVGGPRLIDLLLLVVRRGR
jgi:hypothetical protein